MENPNNYANLVEKNPSENLLGVSSLEMGDTNNTDN